MTTTLTVIHIIGQIILGAFFIYNGVKHFTSHKDYTAYAAMNKLPAPGTAVFVGGILLVLGGLGILFNIYTWIAIILLVVFLIPTSILMHPFWKAENVGERSAQKIAFLKNMAILGGLLIMFQI